MPFKTPFHERTSQHCVSQEWRDWSGYLSVAKYLPTHDHEYYSVRNSAGLLDISPLYKYEISGPDASTLVNRIITRDINKCKVGQIVYTPWCDSMGKVIDDGTVWRLGENRFRITAADPSYRWFEDCGYGLNFEIQDISESTAALALQGPKSRDILLAIGVGPDLRKLKYYQFFETVIDGYKLTISRTGFTGDLGYELWVAPESAESLWDLIMDRGKNYGLTPIGLIALDMLRIEAGLLLIDVDYKSSFKAVLESQKSSPFEIGLGWTVKLNKPNFIGKDHLEKEFNEGSNWSFVGLDIDWESLEKQFGKVDLPPQIPHQSSRNPVPIYKNNKHIGQATSITFSPILKKYIALATVESKFNKPGNDVDIEISVEYQRSVAKAKITSPQFFNPKRKRDIINE